MAEMTLKVTGGYWNIVYEFHATAPLLCCFRHICYFKIMNLFVENCDISNLAVGDISTGKWQWNFVTMFGVRELIYGATNCEKV